MEDKTLRSDCPTNVNTIRLMDILKFKVNTIRLMDILRFKVSTGHYPQVLKPFVKSIIESLIPPHLIGEQNFIETSGFAGLICWEAMSLKITYWRIYRQFMQTLKA